MKIATVDTHRIWISNKEAQKYLGVSKDWFKARRNDGTFHYALVDKTIFYIKSEIDNYIREHAVNGVNHFKNAK